MVETAWRLGGNPELSRLRAWAYTLGFAGHWLTKSRNYSVTFSSLRAERQAWRIAHRARGAADPSQSITVGTWKWVGTGWRTRGDAWLARIAQRERERSRIEAREALCLEKAGWSSREESSGQCYRHGKKARGDPDNPEDVETTANRDRAFSGDYWQCEVEPEVLASKAEVPESKEEIKLTRRPRYGLPI